jgi:hypothetical protein
VLVTCKMNLDRVKSPKRRNLVPMDHRVHLPIVPR